ncbi:vesicular inhibitory amino acid transporter isoform X1 [Hydra vulgaris]|uniref:vesicular inhibitory amino acid transporter isoform X1 n=2 Tax=Hydra vulgaris TaxID=6087 RepID=UPI001F5E3A75|nr:vesicular inhibitory amino acid transporter isoform X1 [Hydra vulgaris]
MQNGFINYGLGPDNLHSKTYGSILEQGSFAERPLWYTDEYASELSICSSDTESQDCEKYYHSGDQETSNQLCDYKDSTASGSFVNSGQDKCMSEHTYPLCYNSAKNVGLASGRLVAWNLINLIVGTSLLAFPYALQQAGLIVLPFILIIALIMNYTSHILIDMMYEESIEMNGYRIRVRMNYADIVEDTLNSPCGSLIMQIIQTIEMLAKCVLNICVLGQLSHEIFQTINIKLCTVIAGGLVLPSFFIRKLVLVGWLQTLSVISLSIGLVIVVLFCLVNVSKWNVANLPICNIVNLPLAIGIIVYAFGIHGVMPGLEGQMRKPQNFGIAVNITFVIALVIQSFFSVTNVLLYGVNTRQVITIDLQSHFGLGVATAIFIGISILCHFSLPTIVVMEKLEVAAHHMLRCCHFGNSKYEVAVSILLRMFIIMLSVTIAAFLPYFAHLMGFIGSSVIVLTSMIIPCVLHLKLRKKNLCWYQVVTDIFIIVLGLAVIVVGVFYNICQLVYVNQVKNL